MAFILTFGFITSNRYCFTSNPDIDNVITCFLTSLIDLMAPFFLHTELSNYLNFKSFCYL